MRIVPLIAALGLLARLAFGEDISVAAGKSPAAVKLQNDGLNYLLKGDYVNARKNFDGAIRLDPTLWPTYLNRAQVDMKEHKFRQGLQDATLALQGKTSFNRSAVLRAEINARMGNYSAAFHELDQVLSLGARGDAYPQALNALAWLHATCREPRYRNARLAIVQAMQSCSLTAYKKAGLIDTLAAAYAEAGDFDAAVRFEQKAIALGESPDAMEDFQKHLASFRQHHPWRE